MSSTLIGRAHARARRPGARVRRRWAALVEGRGEARSIPSPTRCRRCIATTRPRDSPEVHGGKPSARSHPLLPAAEREDDVAARGEVLDAPVEFGVSDEVGASRGIHESPAGAPRPTMAITRPDAGARHIARASRREKGVRKRGGRRWCPRREQETDAFERGRDRVREWVGRGRG